MLFIFQSFVESFFTFFCLNATFSFLMQFSIFCFKLQFRSCFFFYFHLHFCFIYVSISFTFLLLVSFGDSCCSSWLGWVWFGRWKRIVRCTAIALGYPTILNAPFNRNRFWLLQKDVSRRWEGCDQNSMELDSWWQRHKFG